jgi:hypothetical protein
LAARRIAHKLAVFEAPERRRIGPPPGRSAQSASLPLTGSVDVGDHGWT